jgi:hypothetical protein
MVAEFKGVSMSQRFSDYGSGNASVESSYDKSSRAHYMAKVGSVSTMQEAAKRVGLNHSKRPY